MSIVTHEYEVTLTFIEPLLGTAPKDKELYATYIAGKREEDEAGQKIDASDELETVPEDNALEEKGWTGFHDIDGTPILYDYMVRGYFKSAIYSLRRSKDTLSSKITAYRKKVAGNVFVEPRRIPLDPSNHPGWDELREQYVEAVWPDEENDEDVMGVLERSLRAQTPQGERTALVRSDCLPPGTTATFTVTIVADALGKDPQPILEEWLEYGRFHGIGQWRSGGYGRFTYEIAPV